MFCAAFCCILLCSDGLTGSLRHLYNTPADRSAMGGVGLDAAALMTSPRMTSSSSLRPRGQRQPAFLETDFTVPLTGLDPHRHLAVGGATDYYVIASRDAVRPAHTGSSPASRRLAGFGPPTMSRTSMLSPISRPTITAHGRTAYPQRRDIHPSAALGSPLSPQSNAAFVLLPASTGLSRPQGSRQIAGNAPGPARASSTLHSPPGSHHHYRTIQPKPSPTSVRYLTGPVTVQPAGVVFQPSRVTSDRRPIGSSFAPVGGAVSWRAETSHVLNVPRVPAAAHGSRPLPAAHASSGGPRGPASGRGSMPSSGVVAALSLTIDDQAPLDCSRKSSSGDSIELDMPAVLNLTTSGHGGTSSGATSQENSTLQDHTDGVSTSATRRGSSTLLDHVQSPTLPQQISNVEHHQVSVKLEQTRPTAGSTPDGVVQAGGQQDRKMSLNDLEDVSPAPACLASSEDRSQDTGMTSVDLREEQDVKTNISDMTLNVLEKEKAVPVDLAPSDVTPAFDYRDVDMTSSDLENVKLEQRDLTNVDDVWKNKQPSPASEGLFLVH